MYTGNVQAGSPFQIYKYTTADHHNIVTDSRYSDVWQTQHEMTETHCICVNDWLLTFPLKA